MCASDDCYGYTDFEGILPDKIPVCAVLGDSHAAFFAQGCVSKGDVKATYGTGSSIMMNTSDNVFPNRALSSSIGFKIDGMVNYVLEGNISSAGAAISWLMNDVHLISSPKETEKLCLKAAKNDGVYFIPAFSGLSAPYWNEKARGMLCGISRKTGRNEIVRAVTDSIAYSVNDVITAMCEDMGLEINNLKTDGGAAENQYLMQLQSNISNCIVRASSVTEMSALGVAFVAGTKIGMYPKDIYKSIDCIIFSPEIEEKERKNLTDGWKKAIKMILR